jgi:hypothetical protein
MPAEPVRQQEVVTDVADNCAPPTVPWLISSSCPLDGQRSLPKPPPLNLIGKLNR